ncbi:DNA/RNA non-specific endonuclease [Hymenobacter roseosalivarius DSM 11622]|uniref:DNA/RNA non-specific endonuclease n=1 Tax=Hymenobacter roseosalivarius DSM 11622 TaxID=645990 RepID=A0A1W1W4H7_9BACT|nr:DNA/RNA non-specific endonuclease [Hymenobacter roseosalivarius]SMC00360.1 DNA/RNA non-specific endonuclease [Hymenobacter roseosalivarius DSM 11622]
MRLSASLLFSGLLLTLAPLACSQQTPETTGTYTPTGPPAIPVQSAGPALLETFETGSKGAYAEADEALPSGSWHFTDGLIGAAPADHKNGTRAARLRNRGRLRMNFDAPAGTQSIRVSSAAYGDDAPSTWELWVSQDGGRQYQRAGQAVRASGPRLVANTFAVIPGGKLRLEIRKTDGGNTRLNLDDIALLTAAGTTPAPPTAPPAPDTPPPSAIVVSRDDNMALGNPSGATSSISTPNNYLLTRPQYAMSYNAGRGIPNWVSWHLNRAWLGSAPRQDDFRPDPALPRGFYQVSTGSYLGSGFDRGHNCPSADRTTDLDDNSATFLTTNMIPQAANNNQRTWAGLEEYGRRLVDQGQEVYIIMGSYGKGGTGLNGLATTIDQGRITVPARVWKVLVILPEGTDDLHRIAAGQARVLAVDTPNDQSVSPDWSRYRVSVDAIEEATGLDLLSKLPPEAQDRLEARVDTSSTR